MEHRQGFDFQSVLNSIYNGIIAIDVDGMINYFNNSAERIFNIPSDEAINRYVLDVLPNTGGKLVESLNIGKPFYGEKLKGEKVTLVSNINPIVSNGKICGVVSVFQEISEIESILNELNLFKNMKNWLDTIIDSSYDGLWICDHDGKVIRINKASERINNVKSEEIIGKSARDLVVEGLIDRSVNLEVLEKKTSVTMIQLIRGKKRILVTGNPIFDEKGRIAFIVTNERDITELDDLRNQLQTSKTLVKKYISKLTELEMESVDFANIIFRSSEMERIIKRALRAAEVDSTILLTGESGVGKGMIAKLVHKHSERNNGPFIRVDCGGIPDTLIESELFGYEKGAFTGAKTDGKPGFFELADGGTLFLDEIGEISLPFQSKFLRFVEDHEIIRVGGTEFKKIDARVIAATNRKIEGMVASKHFREDLYYRLNVVAIHIPALRERRDDILSLVYHFLEKFNKTYRKEKVLSPEVADILYIYDFPGNIRELSNIIERLVVLTERERIEPGDLPDSVVGYMAKEISCPFLLEEISLKDAQRKCETYIIEKITKKYGSQHEAAKILKVDQSTISRKMRKYET
jgi:PAS domain S-box-containing protein